MQQSIFSEVRCITAHHQQPKNMVCLELNCANTSLICSHCLYNDHSGHKTIPLENFRQNMLRTLSENAERGKETGSSFNKKMIKVQHNIEGIQEKIDQTLQNIIDTIESDLNPILLSFLPNTYEKQKNRLKTKLSQKLITQDLRKINKIKGINFKSTKNLHELFQFYDMKLSRVVEKFQHRFNSLLEDLVSQVQLCSISKVAAEFQNHEKVTKQKHKYIPESQTQKNRVIMRAPEKHKIIEKKSIKQKPSKEEDQKSKQKVSEVQSAQPLSLKVLNHRKREGGGFDYLIDVDSQKKWYKDKDVEDFNDEIREYWRNTKH